MTFFAYVGSIDTPSANGNVTYSDPGFQPKVIIFFGSVQNAQGDFANGSMQWGWATGGANADNYGWSGPYHVNNQAALTVVNGSWEVYSPSSPLDTGGPLAYDGDALKSNGTVVAFTSTGFTVNWRYGPNAGWRIYYLALGGTDITNVCNGSFPVPGATGNQAVRSTTTGSSTLTFKPDLVLFSGGTVTGTAYWGRGAATDSTHRFCTTMSAAGTGTMASANLISRLQDTTKAMHGLATGGGSTDNCIFDLVSMDSPEGFTVNWTNITNPPANGIHYLAIKGGTYGIGSFTKNANTTDTTHTITDGKSRTPTAYMIIHGAATTNTVQASPAGENYGIGASDGTRQAAGVSEATAAVLNTQGRRYSNSDRVLMIRNQPTTVAGTTRVAMAHSSMNSTGFVLSYLTNSVTTQFVIPYITFGPAPGPTYHDITGSAAGASTMPGGRMVTRFKPVGGSTGLNLAVGVASTSGYRSAVTADTPVGWWRLGDTAGTTAVDSASGGTNGSYGGTYTLNQAGALTGDTDKAVDFNTGWVSIADSAALRTPVGNSWTMEAWVKPTATTPSTQEIIRKDNAAGGYFIRLSTTNFTSFWSLAGGLNVQRNGGGVTAGVWNHVVATFDGAWIRHYTNGAHRSSQAETRTLSFSTVQAYIGVQDSGGGEAFVGQIDEVAVYNYALSPQQIAAHYNAAPLAPAVIQSAHITTSTVAGSEPSATGALTALKAIKGFLDDFSDGVTGTRWAAFGPNGATEASGVMSASCGSGAAGIHNGYRLTYPVDMREEGGWLAKVTFASNPSAQVGVEQLLQLDCGASDGSVAIKYESPLIYVQRITSGGTLTQTISVTPDSPTGVEVRIIVNALGMVLCQYKTRSGPEAGSWVLLNSGGSMPDGGPPPDTHFAVVQLSCGVRANASAVTSPGTGTFDDFMLVRWRDGDGVIGGFDSGDLTSTKLYGVITFAGVANEWLQIFSAGGAASGNLGVASAPFTFIALIRPDITAGYKGIFQNGSGPGQGSGTGFWVGINGGTNHLVFNLTTGSFEPTTPALTTNQWQLIAIVIRSSSAQSSYIYNFETPAWQSQHSTASLTPSSPTGKSTIGNFIDSTGVDNFSEWYKGDMAWIGIWPLDKSNGGANTPADIQAFVDNGPWPYVFNSSFFMAFDTDDLLDEAG